MVNVHAEGTLAAGAHDVAYSWSISVLGDLRHLPRIHAPTIDLDPEERRLDLANVCWRELDV
jgi:hypothetical protein